MKFLKNAAVAVCLLSAASSFAKQVEYVEDAYTIQAPQEVSAIVNQEAQFMGFDKKYEVVAPKKAGLQLNPWNKFIGAGINPVTKNAFIIANPDWFLKLPADQQKFFLARDFLRFEHGIQPLSVKIIPFVYVFATFALMVLLYFALAKTRLVHHKKWVRALVAYGIVAACNLAFLNAAQLKLVAYLNSRHDTHINRMAVEKTGNKEAAIAALENLDATIKDEIKNDETFFAPYKDTFGDLAQALKK